MARYFFTFFFTVLVLPFAVFAENKKYSVPLGSRGYEVILTCVNCHDGELVDRFLQGDRAAANRIKNDARANKRFLIHSTVLLPSDLKKFVSEK